MSDLSNPHDKFFKETFSQPEVARDFFANYLPQPVTAVLDLNTLALQPDSFIDPDLQEQFADLLYSVGLRDGGEAYIYALLEHKSRPEPYISFQLIRYMVRIWETDRREKRPLRPIIPIVVYHGREPWRIATHFGGLFSGDEALRPYWPDFRYELHDLSALSDADIHGAAQLQIGLLVLKYIFDPALRHRLHDIFALFKELSETKTALEYLRTVLYYISKASAHLEPAEMVQAVQAVLQDGGNETMQTVADYWIEQGIEQGIERGIEQGIERGIEQSIVRILRRRFGDAPPEVTVKLEELTLPDLETVLDEASVATDLQAFVGWLTAVP